MCRLAAYLGKAIYLKDFFSEPDHSLLRQAWQPKQMQEATLNADGFGIGWYDHQDNAVSYKQTLPAWSDTNLHSLGNSFSRSLWLGYVRSATPGQLVHIGNTQPFTFNGVHFLHNGLIEGFQSGIKQTLADLIDKDLLTSIQSDTDSAWIAALLQQQLKQTTDIGQAMAQCCAQLQSVVGAKKVLMNIIVSDGNVLYALRHAINAGSPTLYILLNGKNFPESILIASEPFDDDSGWQAMDAHHYLSVNSSLDLTIKPIDTI